MQQRPLGDIVLKTAGATHVRNDRDIERSRQRGTRSVNDIKILLRAYVDVLITRRRNHVFSATKRHCGALGK